MEIWKKPTLVVYDKNVMARMIRANAYTVGEAMSIGALCDKGVGAVGVVQLPDGTVAEAYVAAIDAANGIATLIINGVKRFWNWLTGIFS